MTFSEGNDEDHGIMALAINIVSCKEKRRIERIQ
jgi:hypothetical protein